MIRNNYVSSWNDNGFHYESDDDDNEKKLAIIMGEWKGIREGKGEEGQMEERDIQTMERNERR